MRADAATNTEPIGMAWYEAEPDGLPWAVDDTGSANGGTPQPDARSEGDERAPKRSRAAAIDAGPEPCTTPRAALRALAPPSPALRTARSYFQMLASSISVDVRHWHS